MAVSIGAVRTRAIAVVGNAVFCAVERVAIALRRISSTRCCRFVACSNRTSFFHVDDFDVVGHDFIENRFGIGRAVVVVFATAAETFAASVVGCQTSADS